LGILFCTERLVEPRQGTVPLALGFFVPAPASPPELGPPDRRTARSRGLRGPWG